MFLSLPRQIWYRLNFSPTVTKNCKSSFLLYITSINIICLSQLVVPETGEEISQPNITGELLLKGPRMAVRMILFILILAIYYIKNFKIRNSCFAIPLALIILSLRKTVRYELQFSNFVVGHEYFMKCSVIKDCFYFLSFLFSVLL